MKVLDSKVVVQVIKENACTKIGDFVIPEGNDEYEKAKVVEIGPKVENLAVGDVVYIYPHSGKEIKIDDQKYQVITINEIIVVL